MRNRGLNAGLNRKRRRWWKVLIVIAAGMINPILGGLVDQYIGNRGGITTSDSDDVETSVLSNTNINDEDITDADVSIASNTLQSSMIPALNSLAEKLEPLLNTTTATSRMAHINVYSVLETLNNILKDVAILQAYVSYVKSTGNRTLIMSLSAIEPYLAKLNTLVTDTINMHDLQSQIKKVTASVVASDIKVVNGMSLSWGDNQVFKRYESLEVTQNSTEPVVITPTHDNPVLSATIIDLGTAPIQTVVTAEDLATIQTDTTLPTTPTVTNTTPTKTNKTSLLYTAIGVTTLALLLKKLLTKPVKK
ncbi:MAG: hypothetical protein COA88_13545 [Kordia sp.]|nr:MAG: hypothetical protein COA88_13545 [Kordia sp.]